MSAEILYTLDLMIENERQVARFYRAVAELIPAHRAVWDLLSSQEEGHAEALLHVRGAVEQRPLLFAQGRYSPDSARRMIRDVSAMTDDIRGGRVHPQYALTFAGDIEQALLESGLDQVVTTTVAEVLETLNWLRQQTAAHRETLRSVAL